MFKYDFKYFEEIEKYVANKHNWYDYVVFQIYCYVSKLNITNWEMFGFSYIDMDNSFIEYSLSMVDNKK